MRLRILTAALSILLGVFVSGCGDDDETPDISGLWTGTTTRITSDCGNTIGQPESAQFVVTQNDNRFIITTEEGLTISGTIEGNDFEFSLETTVTEDGCTFAGAINGNGTATSERITGTFTQDVRVLSGPCGPGLECHESFSLVATRN